nr:sialidase family protein [Candidatus Sigynarchaeota archaeon]
MNRLLDKLIGDRLGRGLDFAVDLFTQREGGYHTFRIPGLLALPNDTVLAFCEGRKYSHSDFGDIDLIMKRSTDGGTTWSPLQLIWDAGELAVQNPCPVLDRSTGTIFLHTVVNRRDQYVLTSDDQGQTWSAPRPISVRKPGWAFTWCCPGHGIQLRSGRLLIPGVSSTDGEKESNDAYGAFYYFSDDHGQMWKVGHDFGQGWNEFMAAERGDGAVYAILRPNRGRSKRIGGKSNTFWSVSTDGGETSSVPAEHLGLPSPVCEASIVQYSASPTRLLFTNPAFPRDRYLMTLKGSADNGQTWQVLRRLYLGRSAYSDIALLHDKTVCVLFERGLKQYSDKLTFVKITIDPAWSRE